jgi:hypothetical protein
MISDSTISKAREQAARTLWDVPAAAKADPSTSHRAAAEVTASGVRGQNVRKVAHLVRLHPRCTSRELAATSDARELFIDRYEAGAGDACPGAAVRRIGQASDYMGRTELTKDGEGCSSSPENPRNGWT